MEVCWNSNWVRIRRDCETPTMKRKKGKYDDAIGVAKVNYVAKYEDIRLHRNTSSSYSRRSEGSWKYLEPMCLFKNISIRCPSNEKLKSILSIFIEVQRLFVIGCHLRGFKLHLSMLKRAFRLPFPKKCDKFLPMRDKQAITRVKADIQRKNVVDYVPIIRANSLSRFSKPSWIHLTSLFEEIIISGLIPFVAIKNPQKILPLLYAEKWKTKIDNR